jgi:AcrR family transcriptional regulator
MRTAITGSSTLRVRQRGGTQIDPLSVEAIVEGGLRVVARDGLTAVTVRSVAEELGVTSPAIYHYVRGRDDLVARMCERVASEVPLDRDDDLPWSEQLVAVIVSMHEGFSAFPGIGLHTLSLDGPAPAAERIAGRMLRILASAGYDGTDSVRCVSALFFYFSGWLLERPPILPGGAGGGLMSSALLADGARYLVAGFAVATASTADLSTNRPRKNRAGR